jgi:hypothetical protein
MAAFIGDCENSGMASKSYFPRIGRPHFYLSARLWIISKKHAVIGIGLATPTCEA